MAEVVESDYGSQNYWETLYATRYANKTFDWYQVVVHLPNRFFSNHRQDYEALSPFLCPHLVAEKEILVIGCGNSTLSTKVCEWRVVVN